MEEDCASQCNVQWLRNNNECKEMEKKITGPNKFSKLVVKDQVTQNQREFELPCPATRNISLTNYTKIASSHKMKNLC